MRFMLALASFAIMVLVLASPVLAGDKPSVNDGLPNYLYVMSAKSGTFSNGTLSLKGIASVIYFSDRPKRIAGHITLQRFIAIWSKGTDSMKNDPPNATLSILDGSTVTNIVVMLSDLVFSNNTITFKIKPLEGKIPTNFGHASLFIDASGAGIGYGFL